MTDQVIQKPKARRGFAAMPREKMLEFASKGGASVPAEKRMYYKDGTLAKDCARMGGHAKAAKTKVVEV